MSSLPRTARFPVYRSLLCVATLNPMDLDDRDIQEFMRLWQEEFKETISAADARHCASQLLELYGILACPLPEGRHKVE